MRSSLSQSAYEVIERVQPSLVETIKSLLDLGQSPEQITNKIARHDVALAGLCEMAIDHIQKTRKVHNGQIE